MSKDSDHVWDLMENIATCMMVTRDARELRARPMAAYVRRHEDAIYFLIDRRQHKDDEIAKSPGVCLAFADNSGERYVSLTGHAEMLTDRAKIRELWSSSAKAYWETAEDANIRLLKVTPHDAQFWDSPDPVETYVAMAASSLTGKPPEPGENRKVRMEKK